MEQRTVPCRIRWCDAAAHPATDPDRHFAHVGTFSDTTDGSKLEVTLGQTATHDAPIGPFIALRRSIRTLDAQLDMLPGEALVLAEILAALGRDPTELIRIGAALASAAATLRAYQAEAGR